MPSQTVTAVNIAKLQGVATKERKERTPQDIASGYNGQNAENQRKQRVKSMSILTGQSIMGRNSLLGG